MTLSREVRYIVLRSSVESPFVPIDQLPGHLRGLPYRLELLERDAEGWKSVGLTQLPASMLSVQVSPAIRPEQSAPPTGTTFRAPDHSVRKDPVMRAQLPQSIRQETSYVSAPSGVEPDPSKKKYCTYWIRHNSCDFMQEGCKYKHEMPEPKKLKELGFPDVPEWYKKKMAISNWLRPCSTRGDDDHQLSSQPPATRSFRPITSTQLNSPSQPAEAPEKKPTDTPAQIPNLIDLDNTYIETTPLFPALPIDAVSEPRVENGDVIDTKPTRRLTRTLASSLRNNESSSSSDQEEFSSLIAAESPTSSRHESQSPQDCVPSLPSPLHQNEMFKNKTRQNSRKMDDHIPEATGGSRIIDASPKNVDKESAKPSKPREKSPRPSLGKANRRSNAPATRLGLGSSQYATAETPEKIACPNKGVKCRGASGSMAVQTRIPLRPHASLKSGKFGKDVNPADVQLCTAPPVATSKGHMV